MYGVTGNANAGRYVPGYESVITTTSTTSQNMPAWVRRQQLAAAAEQQEEAVRAARERAARQAEVDVDCERAVAGERARLAADQ